MTFFIYWNEAKGNDVEKFWKEIYFQKIDYERKDTIKSVLKRNLIKNQNEYDIIIDTLVVAEQIRRINLEQKKILSQLIGKFERNKFK